MKLLKIMMLATVLISSTYTTKSQAAIGAIFSPGLVTAGLVLTGVGALATVPGLVKMNNGSLCSTWSKCSAEGGLFFGGIISAAFGIILLDEESTFTYTTLTELEANELNINLAERKVFNSEIDEVNMLVALVDTKLSKLETPTIEESAKAWESVKGLIAPETFSSLVKVTQQIYK